MEDTESDIEDEPQEVEVAEVSPHSPAGGSLLARAEASTRAGASTDDIETGFSPDTQTQASRAHSTASLPDHALQGSEGESPAPASTSGKSFV